MLLIIKCPECGSEKVESKRGMRKTLPPEGTKRDRFKRVTYGYFYMANTCLNCKHIWEDRI